MGVVTAARARHHDEFHGKPLDAPAGMPRQMLAELHYLYALLVFSDAKPGQARYTGFTECGRIEYDRDGVRWVLVIRKDDTS